MELDEAGSQGWACCTESRPCLLIY